MNTLGTAALGACLLALGTSVGAEPATERVEGVILQIDLSRNPRTVRVKTEGREVVAELSARTLVVFEGNAARTSAAADVASLTPGMTVRLVHDAQGVASLHVLAVPDEKRTERTVRARLRDLRYDADRRRGEVWAEIAGRNERHAADDPNLIRGFRRGDLVVLGLAADGSLVSMQPASLKGRVTRIDARRREVTVELEGRSEAFAVAEESLLDRVRAGDLVRFDVAERSGGRRVITYVY